MAARTQVDILPQGGVLTVYDAVKGARHGIQITMEAIREVDSNGTIVGFQGDEHGLSSFAKQYFKVSNPESVVMGSAAATKTSLTSQVSYLGEFGVDAFVFGGDAVVGPPGERWNVSAGDFKWNVGFSGWAWCGCGKGADAQTGEHIDVDFSVRGLADVLQVNGIEGTLDLGGGMTCLLSNQVQIDGQWVQMPKGFPVVAAKGPEARVTVRFPKFATSAVYDPVILGLAAPEPPATTATGPATATATETTTEPTAAKPTTTATTSTGTDPAAPTTTTEAASRVAGTMDLTVPDCDAFAALPKVKDSLASGIAQAAGSEISASDITVWIECKRRLAADVLRRLDGTTAVVAYTITIPAARSTVDAASVAVALQSETPASMTEKISTAMQESGIDTVKVSVDSIEPPVVSTPAPAPTPAPQTTTARSRGSEPVPGVVSATRRPAAWAALAAAAGALAMA